MIVMLKLPPIEKNYLIIKTKKYDLSTMFLQYASLQ